MLPDSSRLIMQMDLTLPLLGFYDAPVMDGFGPLVFPETGKHMCTASSRISSGARRW